MKHIRKSCFLIVLLLLVLFVSCSLADKSSGNYKYKVSTDGKAIITKYIGSERTINVPNTIDGHDVCSIGDKAFYDCEGIEEVVLPDSILSIGKYSFAYCDDLITISTAATSIDEYAFKYCESLVTVNLTASEVEIDEQAFYSCESLETVNGTVKNPGEYSFAYCENLKAITITGDVIDKYAFKYCEDLQIVTVLSDSIIVKEQAFYSCEALKTFTGTAKDIEEYGFAYDKKLEEIKVSGQEIGEYAFKYCDALQTLTLITPKTKIGQQAFYSCEKLKTINGIVGDIDEYGFAYCEKLTTVQFAGTSIEDDALRYCKSVKFEIPNDPAVESAVKKAGIKYEITDLIVSDNTLSADTEGTSSASANETLTLDPSFYEEWTCQNCGSDTLGNFCDICGNAKEVKAITQSENDDKKEKTDTETAKPEENQDPNAWICPNCGTQAAGNFCFNCGTARSIVSEQNTVGQTEAATTVQADDTSKEFWCFTDNWHKYKATFLSEEIIKVECWSRFNYLTEDFSYGYDALTFKTSDNSREFKWLDQDHNIFTIFINDSKNSNLKDARVLAFTKDRSSLNGISTYSFTHDNWNSYRAIAYSDSVILIETWYRFNYLTDDFEHTRDLCLVIVGETSNDFEWVDNEHSAFTITLDDEDNSEWDEPEYVVFSKQ